MNLRDGMFNAKTGLCAQRMGNEFGLDYILRAESNNKTLFALMLLLPAINITAALIWSLLVCWISES